MIRFVSGLTPFVLGALGAIPATMGKFSEAVFGFKAGGLEWDAWRRNGAERAAFFKVIDSVGRGVFTQRFEIENFN